MLQQRGEQQRGQRANGAWSRRGGAGAGSGRGRDVAGGSGAQPPRPPLGVADLANIVSVPELETCNYLVTVCSPGSDYLFLGPCDFYAIS